MTTSPDELIRSVSELPLYYSNRRWAIVRRASILEYLGHNYIERAIARLTNLEKEGHFEFVLNTASKPLPFAPARVRCRRQAWRPNTIYNNLTPCTRFLPDERKLVSVNDAAKQCGFDRKEFRRRCEAFHRHFELEGEWDNLRSWSGYDITSFEMKFSSYSEDERLKGLFKAAAKSSSFAVLKDIGVVSISSVPCATKKELRRALDRIFIALNVGSYAEAGVVVPSLFRAFLMWGWLIASVSLVTFAAAMGWSDMNLFEKDHIELLVFASISLPALIEYITPEPEVIRHALRGTKVLWKNSQVKEYFKLSEFDYAVMALIPAPNWLVSDRTASFLQKGGHQGLLDDIYVTDTQALRKVGVFVGYFNARKEWEDRNVTIVPGSDGSVTFLDEEADEPYIAGQCDLRQVA